MKLDRVLTWIIWGWIILIMLAKVSVIVAMGEVSPNHWEGIRSATITEISDFNPLYFPVFLAQLVWLSPAIGAYVWRRQRRRKILPKSASIPSALT